MGLTEKQKITLEAIGQHGQNFNNRGMRLGVTDNTVDQRLTSIYESFLEYAQIVGDYFPVFWGRMSRHPEMVKELVLGINRQINQELSNR